LLLAIVSISFCHLKNQFSRLMDARSMGAKLPSFASTSIAA
jgi:hypothetical protein